jgi:acyl-CoA synthetase (AMP-forming)/AMP-acid ligase II
LPDVEELTYHRLLLGARESYADRVTVVDGPHRDTLAASVDRSLRISDAHRRTLGLQHGDTFAVVSGNSREFVSLWHAAMLGGAVINPVNLRLARPEMEGIINDAGSRVVYVDAAHADLVDAMRSRLGQVERVVLIGGGEGPCDTTLEELVADAQPVVPSEPSEDAPCALTYTGGTTGTPRGALHSNRSRTLAVYRYAMLFGVFARRHTFLQCLPMFHSAGLVGALVVPASGGTVVVHPRFDAQRVIADVEHHRVTLLGLVPTMIQMTMEHPDMRPEALTSLECVFYGGSPIPPAVLARLAEVAPNAGLVQIYGMTEAATLTYLSPDDHRAGGVRLASCGRPLPGIALCIHGPDGQPVARGETGEICVRAGVVMTRYHDRPDETAEVLRAGWYHTGDVGYLDDDGYLFLVDRAKDMIVSGGENVYSVEVEQAISAHPAVAQVAVIGIPHERWGEAVHAIVVVRDQMTLAEAEVIAHARTMIAGYKVPKSVEIRTEALPLSGTMKVLKAELRRPFWEGRTRSVH